MGVGGVASTLFHLSSTFRPFANTQRELRRAIHHLAERRFTELGTNNAFDHRGIAPASRSPDVSAETENTIGPDVLAPLAP